MTTLKVCTSILIGFLCAFSNKLTASNINTHPSVELFESIHTGTDKKGLIENATYFRINKAVLKQIHQQKLETMTLQIPFGASKKLELKLQKASFITDKFRATLQQRASHNTLSYSPGLFYRGAISGVKDALVALNFYQNEVTGVLSLNGENYNIGRLQNDHWDTFVLYKERDLNASNPFSCATEKTKELIFPRNNIATKRSSSSVSLYVECDYHLFQANGSDAQRTIDFATGLFNVVSAIYAIDGIKVELSEVKVWTVPDPYPTGSAREARDAFGASLNGNFNGDIAHLLSNYKVNGTVPNGGSANIDALCDKQKAVGYTNITISYNNYPTYSWTAYAVTHEIGHNLGSPHTHSCLWPTGPIDNCWCPEGDCDLGDEPAASGGTIMSYCHLNPQWTNDCELSAANPGINLAGGFGAIPGALIREKIESASCLGSNGGGVVFVFQASAKAKNETCNKQNGTITLTVSYGETPYTYQWSNGAKTKNISNLSEGGYSCTITDNSGKTTKVEATVSSSKPVLADAGTDKSINCKDPIVILDGTNSESGFGYVYEWTKVGSNLTGNVRQLTLPVSASGTYILMVKNIDTDCEARDTVIVSENFSTPNVTLSGETITCNNKMAAITVAAGGMNLDYQWIGPNDYTSIVKNPIVEVAGTYELLATGANGCTIKKSIKIIGSQEIPEISVQGGILTCTNSSTQLAATSSVNNSKYNWTGPNDFQSSNQNPIVVQAGLYTLIITAPNGCSSEITTNVVEQKAAPIVSAKGGTLDCNNPVINFQINTDESNLNYTWTGPNNFSATEKNPITTIAGNYQLVARTDAGCSTTLNVLVEENFLQPIIAIKGEDIDCKVSTAVLKALSNDAIQSYNWGDKNGFISNEKNIEVSKGGIYNLTVSGSNGCTTTTTFEVKENTDLPIFEVKGKDLSCANPTAELNVVFGEEQLTFNWTGPDNFQSIVANPMVEIPGIYYLLVSNENGCSKSATININRMEQPVIQFAVTTSLSCNRESLIIDASSSTMTPNAIAEWTTTDGNVLSIINDLMIEVDAAGTYALTIRDLATECVISETIKIESTPNISAKIENKNLLNCQQTSVTLSANGGNYSSTTVFNWLTDEGHIITDPTQKEITIDKPGFYTLFVKDTITGCYDITFTNVTQTEKPQVNLDNPKSLTCFQKTITINGAASFLNATSVVEWSRNEIIIPNSNALFLATNVAGNYRMTITDTLNGCQSSAQVEVLKKVAPKVSIAKIESDFCGKSEGSIALIIDAESDYKITWNTGQSETSIENLSAGIYTATVTDIIGCQVVISQSVQSILPVSLGNVEISPITCHDTQNGSIQLNLKGGNFPYYTQWSNGETDLNINGLGVGIHTLEVEDAQGCVTSFDFEMTAPTPLEAAIIIDGNDVNIEVSGGTPDYQLTWNNGINGTIASDLPPGSYKVQIEDANSCQLIKTISIDQTTKLQEVKEELIVLTFPNPTTDYFKVKKDLTENGPIQITVFSIDGQQVITKSFTGKYIDETINTQEWKPGTYFLQVLTNDGMAVSEIQVLRL